MFGGCASVLTGPRISCRDWSGAQRDELIDAYLNGNFDHSVLGVLDVRDLPDLDRKSIGSWGNSVNSVRGICLFVDFGKVCRSPGGDILLKVNLKLKTRGSFS